MRGNTRKKRTERNRRLSSRVKSGAEKSAEPERRGENASPDFVAGISAGVVNAPARRTSAGNADRLGRVRTDFRLFMSL